MKKLIAILLFVFSCTPVKPNLIECGEVIQRMSVSLGYVRIVLNTKHGYTLESSREAPLQGEETCICQTPVQYVICTHTVKRPEPEE